MQPSRLWTLFALGSIAATVTIIVSFDLLPNSPRTRPILAGDRAAAATNGPRGLIVCIAGNDTNAATLLKESLARTKADRLFATVVSAAIPSTADIEAEITRHACDRRRVFLMARSIPLMDAFQLMNATNVFAAAHCRLQEGGTPMDLPERIDVPHLTLVAGDSSCAPAARVVSATAAGQGTCVTYREMEGAGGTEIQRLQRERDLLDDAIVWFTTLRNERIAIPDGKLRALDGIARKRWERLRREDFDEIAQIGGPVAGELILKALSSASDRYRIAASARCKGTWFGQAVLARLVDLLHDPNEIVRLQAIDSLAILARWHNAAAQTALCRATLDPDMSEKDRATVVRELAESVRLDVPLGIAAPAGDAAEGLAYLNPGGAWVLRTFLGLLSSDSPPVRRAAEGAVWMWKVPDLADRQGNGWRKRYADELYESLSGTPDERREAVLTLKQWAEETYPTTASLPPTAR